MGPWAAPAERTDADAVGSPPRDPNTRGEMGERLLLRRDLQEIVLHKKGMHHYGKPQRCSQSLAHFQGITHIQGTQFMCLDGNGVDSKFSAPPSLELSPCLCRASPRPYVYLYCSLCSDQGDILQLEILGSGHHCGNAHPHCTGGRGTVRHCGVTPPQH